jgi:hypothetical protein
MKWPDPFPTTPLGQTRKNAKTVSLKSDMRRCRDTLGCQERTTTRADVASPGGNPLPDAARRVSDNGRYIAQSGFFRRATCVRR